MSPSLRPVPLAVLAAIVGAGALIVYLLMREPSPPAPVPERTATSPTPASDSASGTARPALARGNAAFRAGRYAEALQHYRAAAGAEPASAAPQYGIHMAARKLEDVPLADSALAAIRALTDTVPAARAESASAPAPRPGGGRP